MAEGNLHATAQEGSGGTLVDPPVKWKFNHLLDEFCKQLTEMDLSRVNRIFKGLVTEDVESWDEMFVILESKGVISSDNIVYLQKIAFHLEKDDLYIKALEYANTIEYDILHFRQEIIEVDQEDKQSNEQAKVNSDLRDQLIQKQNQIKKMEKKILSLHRNQAVTPPPSEMGTKRKLQAVYRDKNTRAKHTIDVAVSEEISQDENLPKKLKTDIDRDLMTDCCDTEFRALSKCECVGIKQHELPESEQHLIIDPDNKHLNEKMVHLGTMSTTFRKLVSSFPNQTFPAVAMTPEEINALSLHKKLDRIYPSFLYIKYSNQRRE